MKKTVLLSLMAAAPSPRASRGPLRTFRLTLAALFLAISSPAQIPGPPINLQSPNVASLGLYGDIPVSLFTGTPSIEIPLYTIEERGFKLPLSLTYHSAGIRPDQHPGWAGLGWTFQGGGVIYRTMKDLPDEWVIPIDYENYIQEEYRNAGFYYQYPVLDNTLHWNRRDYLRWVAQNFSFLSDTEPDEFSFSFPGYNGKFYLDHLGNWQVQCDRPVKVLFDGTFLEPPFDADETKAEDNNGYPKSFGGFTIVGEDGAKYVFGGTTDAIEYTINFFEQSRDYWKVNAWHLTKIITPQGDEIDFKYWRSAFVSQMYISFYNILDWTGHEDWGFWNPGYECWSPSGNASLDRAYGGQLIYPVYLDRITSPNCEVSTSKDTSREELRYENRVYFWAYNDWSSEDPYPLFHFLKSETLGYPQCLDQLQWWEFQGLYVKSRTDSKILKRIICEYNNDPTQRMLLTSVIETADSLERKHTFEYNHPERLPDYLSNMVDHWGFYNGRQATAINDADAYYAQREPDAACLQYGILNKITYPTGGYTRFEFEPHYYRKEVKLNRWEGCDELPANKLAGGLRIKRIIQSATGDSRGEVVDKEYHYVSDYLVNKAAANVSSGVLGGRIQYGFSDYTVPSFTHDDAWVRMSVFSSQSVLPACVSSGGNHVGYSEVIEKRADGSFTRYQFTNLDNGHLDDAADATIQLSHTPYEPCSSRDMERGKRTLMEEYSANGTLKRRRTALYERSSNNYVRSMKASWTYFCPARDWNENGAIDIPDDLPGDRYDEGTTYRLYTYTYHPKIEIELTYDGSGAVPVIVTKTYAYNTHGLVRSVSQTVNEGTETVVYRRPEEYGTGVYATMLNAHVLTPVVEEVTTLTAKNGTKYDLRRTRTDYHTFRRGTTNIFVVSAVKDSVAPSRWRTRYACSEFDSYGNPLQVERDGVRTGYIWSYNGRYPVAEIRFLGDHPVSLAVDLVRRLFSATSADGIAQKAIPNETVLQDGSVHERITFDALTTTYTYKSLVGMTSKTTPDKVTTYYEYDALGRLSGAYIMRDGIKEYLDRYEYGYVGPDRQ